MICCTVIAMFFGVLGMPLRRLIPGRNAPLAWRPYVKLPVARVARFRLAARARSVDYALQGIGDLFRSEHNAWVHLAISTFVVAVGLALDVSLADWRWLILSVAMVLAAEALNTAIEALCDLVQPDRHPVIKRVKDLAAGAVLLCAAGAALIGGATFSPYLSNMPPVAATFCGQPQK